MGVAFPIPEIAQNWGWAIGSTGRACECVRVRAIRPAASLAFFSPQLVCGRIFQRRSSDRTAGNDRRARADQSIVIAKITVKLQILTQRQLHRCYVIARSPREKIEILKKHLTHFVCYFICSFAEN